MMLRSSTGLLVALAAPWLGAATLRVPEDHAGIQAAIDAARDGDEVLVAPGEYLLARPILVLSKAATLRSRDGALHTTLRMSLAPEEPQLASVIIFDSTRPGTLLEGFTITGGQAMQGGGVLLDRGHLTISDCFVSRNRARRGGGISVRREATLLLKDSFVTQNFAGNAHALVGGIDVLSSAMTAERSTMSGNYPAGLEALRGNVLLQDSYILGNLSFQGGGIPVRDTALTLVNYILAGNYAAAARIRWSHPWCARTDWIIARALQQMHHRPQCGRAEWRRDRSVLRRRLHRPRSGAAGRGATRASRSQTKSPCIHIAAACLADASPDYSPTG
jgi:hypothetical protein